MIIHDEDTGDDDVDDDDDDDEMPDQGFWSSRGRWRQPAGMSCLLVIASDGMMEWLIFIFIILY